MKIKNFLNSVRPKKISTEIPEKCQVLGRTMYLQKKGPQYRQLADSGIYERETTNYFLKNVSEGDVVLDIGANIGYFTLIFASLVGTSGKVFSFEPEPSNFEILTKNVITNNFENVELHNVAVSDHTGEIELYLSEKAAGQHRIYKSKDVGENHIKVKTVKLDELLNKNLFSDKISFLKIDAEGSEFGILKGMETILSQNKNIKLVMEFSPQQIIDYGAEPLEQLKFLKNLGFNFYSVKNQKEYKRYSLETIISKFTNSSENILCKRT